MYLEIRAEEAKMAAAEALGKNYQNKKEGKSMKQKKKHKKAEQKSQVAKKSHEERTEERKNGAHNGQVKPRKRVITTIVQQIEYFDSEEEEPKASKFLVLENGEGKRQNPQGKKNEMTEKISEMNSIIRNLNLSQLGEQTMGHD